MVHRGNDQKVQSLLLHLRPPSGSLGKQCASPHPGGGSGARLPDDVFRSLRRSSERPQSLQHSVPWSAILPVTCVHPRLRARTQMLREQGEAARPHVDSAGPRERR